MTYKCSGCQREEVHKFCPAYGTLYYMSGMKFTPEIEIALKKNLFHSPNICQADDMEYLEFQGPIRIGFYMDQFNPKIINNEVSLYQLLNRIINIATASYMKGKNSD